MMKSATSPSRQNHPLRLQPLGPIARRAIVPALCGERLRPATGTWGAGRAGGRCGNSKRGPSGPGFVSVAGAGGPTSPELARPTPPSTHGPASPRYAPARSRMAPATSLRSGPSPRGRGGSPSRTTLPLACNLIAPRAHGNPSLMECRVPAAPGVHERQPRAWRTWCCSRMQGLHVSSMARLALQAHPGHAGSSGVVRVCISQCASNASRLLLVCAANRSAISPWGRRNR